MGTSDIDALLDRHRDKFRRLVRQLVAEEQGPDPFAFPLGQYRGLSTRERLEIVRRAGAIARDRVDEELRRRGAAWIVLLGDRVVAESTEIGTCPTAEDVLALGQEEDRVPFLFEAPLVEEVPTASRWAPIGAADAYPTVPLTINAEQLDADLDTGSHGTFLDARFLSLEAPTWFEGRHLGQVFHWSPGRARLALRAAADPVELDLPARFVADWSASPFVRINASRLALVGRDLLRAFGLRVPLASPEQTTTVTGACRQRSEASSP
ncbi:MAG: hypothetical protein JW940_10445 [Polyangiaceae bacterium]|nr:hypothetical protein [Polyangiaceae bacterium]